jgi:hypothetical protein
MSLLQDIYEDVAQPQSIFDAGTVDVEKFKESIKAPYKYAYLSTLGGDERASILLRVSLDPKDTWKYDIMENSRYMHFDIGRNGSIDQFKKAYTVKKKFRKTRVKSLDDAAKKINQYIEEISKESAA